MIDRAIQQGMRVLELQAENEKLRAALEAVEEHAKKLEKRIVAIANQEPEKYSAWQFAEIQTDNTQLRAALEAVEWVDHSPHDAQCPWCDQPPFDGHKPTCQRQQALAGQAEGED
jgi:DNA repair exonuclease SbcCD ATPase subunit